ncbi:MAG: hypothetical protein HY901_19115 [Deltaproteobacteria bacterium]|nr:hypothetical protein [Deltaproteobacteria bacterium]
MSAQHRCAFHTAAPAADICRRCGSFLCFECLQIDQARVLCAACVERVRHDVEVAGTEARKRVRTALAFAALGLLSPLGCIGAGMAARELLSVRKDSSWEAKRWSWLALGLGLGTTALWAVVGLVHLGFFD